MEVVVPVNPPEFDFNASSVYANAPSTPKFMVSAPNSPARIPELDLESEFDQLFVSEFDEANQKNRYSLATIPFAWEEKPGVPKSVFDNNDFTFDVVSGELNEDVFHGNVIKPTVELAVNKERERGRERTSSGLSSSRSRRTRSLPPFRGSEQQPAAPVNNMTPSTCTTLSVFGSRKWSFKDLFLFRSASDGRAMDKDPLKKYSSIFRKHDEDFRNSTLRDRSGSGSGSGSGSRRRGPRVSAHELHYTVNRAVSNDMKKQTFLPYKQGILGRLAFNPTVHALSNGFGNSHHN